MSDVLARRCALGAIAALAAGCDVGVSVGRLPRALEPVTASSVIVALPPRERSDVEQRVRVVDIVAGGGHACVRSSEGAVRCWGSNEFGQLGRSTPNAFDPTPGVAGHGVAVLRVFAGPTQTAVLDEDGQLGHWGLYAPRDDDEVTPWSKHDTPGVQALVGVTFGERFALAWDGIGQVIAWGAPDRASFTTTFVIKPVIVHLGAGFEVAQAAVWSRDGDGHGCLVLRDGTVACWGRNDRGQLGRGPTESGIFQLPAISGVTRVSVGERFSCALRDDASVWCWGANDAGQLGDDTARNRDVPARVPLPGEALALTTGARHACALLRDDAVWCWGSNSAGQLGTSSVEILATAPVRVPDLPKATGVAAGDEFTCARTEDGRALCWGNNEHGQLGDGTTVRRAEARQVAF